MERVRLIDVVEALRKRGRDDEADELEAMITLQLVLFHDLDVEEIQHMKIDDVAAFLNLPPKKVGWDNFYYGMAAIGDNHNG